MNKPAKPPAEQALSALKVVQIGNSLGVVLPRGVLEALNAGKGDKLFVTRSPGGCRLTRDDPDFERGMALARQVMRKRRSALRELAK